MIPSSGIISLVGSGGFEPPKASPADFIPLQLSLPAYAVCGLDFVFIRSGCSPSSLYTFPVGLGSALPSPEGFTEFEECSPTDSSVGLQ